MIARSLGAVAGTILLAQTAGAPLAADLLAPSERVILTVSGAITETNAAGEAQFDRPMLAALGWTTIETFTAWTDGLQRFSGVSLQALLEAVGAEGDTLAAYALNDYTETLPLAEAGDFSVFLALDRNGEPMPVRDKGPIWIIYPSDEPQNETIGPHNHKMVWQLRALEVR